MGENPEMVLHQELRFNIDLNHTLICTVNSNNEHFDPWLDLEIHGETRADLGGKQVDSWSCFGFSTCCITVVTTLQLGWFARMTSVLFFQIEPSDSCPYDFVFEKLSGVKPSKCLKYTNSYRIFKKFGSHETKLYYSSEAFQLLLSHIIALFEDVTKGFFGAHNKGDGRTIAHPYRCEVPGIQQVQLFISAKPLEKSEIC